MEIITLIIALLVCITIHEFSHAITADSLGDPTPRIHGRVSLNPLHHLDPLGTIAMILFHIGWGKPVIINDNNFKNPVRDSALTALAGPMSNLFTAIICASLIKYIPFLSSNEFVFSLLQSIFTLSIVLAVFNLLPIPPFDGSKVVAIFVPSKHLYKYNLFMEKGVAYVMLFLLFDFYILGNIFHFSFIRIIIGFSYDIISTFIHSSI